MKAKEFREQPASELAETIKDLRRTLFDHEFKHGTRQLTDTAVLTRTRRDIARAETVLKEKLRETSAAA